MEIHELNTFSGTLGSTNYFATDNGVDTSKISWPDLVAPLNARIDTIKDGKIYMESGAWTDNAPVTKVSQSSRIRTFDRVLVDSIYRITLPNGYSGYGVVFDSSGNRLGYTSGYVSTLSRADIRARYSNAYSFVFTLRNNSTPTSNISSQVDYVMANTVVDLIKPINYEHSVSSYYGATADLDDIKKAGIWYGPTPNSFVNVPLSFVGSPFLLEVIVEGGVIIQKLTGFSYNQKAIRYLVNNVWGEWASTQSFITVSESSAESRYNNLAENLPANGFFYINTTWFTDMESLGNKVGYLFTFASKLTDSQFELQVFYPATQGNVSCRTRMSGSWTNWRSVAQSEGDYHDANAKYFAFGDSTTYGQIGGGGGQSPFNYPACVGQILNMVVDNRGVTNQGLIKDWDTIHTNFINNLDMTGAKLITVGWAYNDGAEYSSINFGAYDDTGDTTFIGKYFTIMKEFQQKCPDAKIVLVTGYGYSNGTINPVTKPTLVDQFTHKYTFADGQKSVKEVYDELEKMCYAHGWSCVNQAKGTVFNQWNASLLIGDQIHPTSAGYLRYGNHLGARIASLYANIKEW